MPKILHKMSYQEEGFPVKQKRNELQIDMERYEKLFDEFYDKITPITDRVTSYFTDPLTNPHYLSYELLQEMELLHMKLSSALYRLRNGELQEKLKMKEINLGEFDKLTKELDDINKLYKHT